MIRKPKLSLGTKDETTPSTTTARPKLGIKPQEGRSSVKTTKSASSAVVASIGRFFKVIIFILLFAVIVLGVLYSALSATLMFTAPSNDDHTNRVWVTRGAFPGGIAPQGAFVYGSTSQPADTSIPGKALEGYTGSSQYFVGEVIAGPNGEVSSQNGKVLVGGKETPYSGTVKKTLLNQEYLAICKEGNCEVGETIIVPQGNVAGEAKGFVSLTDFTFKNYGSDVGNEPSDAK